VQLQAFEPRVRIAVLAVATLVLLAVALLLGGPELNALLTLYAVPMIFVGASFGIRGAAAFFALLAGMSAMTLWINVTPETTRISVLANFVAVISLSVIAGLLARFLVAGYRAEREHIRETADRDDLTSLYKLQRFLDVAEEHHALALRERRPYAILMIGIEDLKAINARHGIESGNRAIALVARALVRLARDEEILARYGAGRFTILLPSVEAGRADEMARKVKSAVFATTMNVGARVLRIKAHVGVAKYPLNGISVESLLRFAEGDMEKDKSGREPPKNKPAFVRR
jgi:diguanylate cyclase (GGDEF)-like protein